MLTVMSGCAYSADHRSVRTAYYDTPVTWSSNNEFVLFSRTNETTNSSALLERHPLSNTTNKIGVVTRTGFIGATISPNGEIIIVSIDHAIDAALGSLYQCTIPCRKPQLFFRAHGAINDDELPRFSHDGKRIALIRNGNTLVVASLSGNVVFSKRLPLGVMASGVRWGEYDREIAVMNAVGQPIAVIAQLRQVGGERSSVVSWRSMRCPDPTVAIPDTTSTLTSYVYESTKDKHGRVPNTSGYDYSPEIYLWEIGAGAPKRLTFTKTSETSPILSDDGHWLAYRESGQTTRIVVRKLGLAGGHQSARPPTPGRKTIESAAKAVGRG